MKKLSLLTIPGLLIASAAMASVPAQMNVQGRLLDAGSPMTGSHPAVFGIYDAATGGTLLWTESSSLDVQGGIFTATLGKDTPIPAIVFESEPRWLEVTVDGTTLAPRLPLTTGPYAFWSQRADTANFALNSSSTGDNLWSTDGTNAWRATGLVGIGKAPSTVLDIISTTGDHTVNSIHYSAINPKIKLDALASGNHQSEVQFLKNGTTRWSVLDDVNGDDAQTFGIKDWLAGTNPLVINQNGNVGIGTAAPNYSLDIRSADYLHGLNWQVTTGTEIGSYVRFGSNNARGALFIGNANVGGSFGPDEAAILQTTGGWQWTRQLNIMGNVGIGTNSPDPSKALYVVGDMCVTGAKNRLVHDGTYGDLYYNAVESDHANFTASGRGVLSNGKCHVALDPRWLAGVTIDARHPLDVTSIVFYGPHGSWYAIPGATGFDVVDSSGASAQFCWTVQARQRGYEDLDLNGPEPTAAK